MAYNREGQGYPGQYSRYQAPNSQQPARQHSSSHYPQATLAPQEDQARRTSFETGDDRTYFAGATGGAAPGAGGSVASSNAAAHAGNSMHIRMPDQSQFMASNYAANQSYAGGASSYQYQSPVHSPSATFSPNAPYATYNPQQYASTQQQQPYQPSANNSYAAPAPSPPAAYQPYVPAAYQQSNASPPPNYGFPLYEAAAARRQPAQLANPSGRRPVGSPPAARDPPPLLPPRPTQAQYTGSGVSTSQAPSYSNYAPTGHAGANGSSSIPASTYTPPRPPPPPTSLSAYDEAPQPSRPTYQHTNSLGSSTAADTYNSRYQSVTGHHGSSDYTTAAGEGGGRHPQSRPLPAQPPNDDDANSPSSFESGQQFGYEALLQEVEAAVMGRPLPTDPRGTTPRPNAPAEITSHDPLFPTRDGRQATRANGVGSGAQGAYSSESDAEAAAGLAALRMAEEQEAADQAWRGSLRGRSTSQSSQQTAGRSTQRPSHGPLPPVPPQSSSDSDRVPVDMDTYGGGMPGNVSYHYGRDYSGSGLGSQGHGHSTSAASVPYSENSGDGFGAPAMDYYMPPAAPFALSARTDTGGTGGLSEPGAMPRRTSFDDADADETTLYDPYEYGGSSAGASPTRDSSHSRSPTADHNRQRSGSRPLPMIPGDRRGGAPDYQTLSPEQAQFSYGNNVGSDDAYGMSMSRISKTNSIGSYGQLPVPVAPNRSATDAGQRRHGMQIGTGNARPGMFDSTLSPESANVPRDKLGDIVLPSLPAGKRGKFVPSKLTAHDFKRCPEPWALSAILDWLQEMTEGEADLRETLLAEGLVALFTNKLPTLNVADAESLGSQVVSQMFQEGALVHEEEWVKFTGIRMSGVIYQLTGDGCYSTKLHGVPGKGRCYSHHCMRTLKKVDLATQSLAPQRKTEDWATFYKLTKDDITNVDKKEIERQNNLHEIVTSEDLFMDQLNVLLVLYRDGLRTSPQPIMAPKKVDEFIKEVFGRVDAVKKANEDYLLPQLKYRQEEQGPWVKGFADIFREWIRKAKTAYIEYAANFPAASLRMRKEAERNVLFRQFLDQVRENERSRRLGWDTYLKSPITRLQRYSLLLATVYKHSVADNGEKRNLEKAIEEIKNVTLECDARVAEMGKRADLLELSGKLKLRTGMERVQLNLDHLGREIIFRGDLQRKGSNKISWVDTHAILFDHYMVLAKPVLARDATGGVRHYDVSKLPIPMDLLVLESTSDDAVIKSSVKGITATTTNRAQTPQENRLARAASNTTGSTTLVSNPPGNSSMSISSGGSSRNVGNQTVIDAANDKVMYPFRIKHLGRLETYVLYAPSAANRQDWCDKIIEAKTRHASSLFAQNAEPFRLRVLADTAFNFDSTYAGPTSVVIKGTPLDRAIEECDRANYGTGPRPGPICRSMVNCGTSFTSTSGARMMAVGTDFGVFLAEYSQPRSWTKSAAITVSNVTQIAALEEFSLFLVLADKVLIAYNLESVCPPSGGPPSADARKAPQKLSGNKDVGFFSAGRQKERMLIFYKKRDGINSTFKVLEPVYQRGAATTKSRFGLRKGTTDFCRDFDEFYIPSNCFGINLFDKSLAVSTERGLEVLTLDKKQPFSIPDLRGSEVASIAARLKDQKPLGMFRLNDNEFLLVFAGVGIYVDKHGDVSRAVVMEFVGTATQAALYHNTYLVLVDKGGDFVEVRNAINGRLRQVISGRECRLLDDDDGNHGGTIKICMQHPERERVQLVLEMIVNEGQKE